MFMKFIFGIAWIGIFILAIFGIYIGIFPSYLEILDFNNLITRGVVAGVSLVYLLLFIEKLINLFERPKELRMKTPNGMLKISSNSVNNIVKEVVGDHPKVKNLKVKNKTNGKKLKIFVSIDIISSQSLSDDLNLIQQDIKDRIESYLDLSITEVELRVTKLIKERSSNKRGD
jgi:uncharacterized alkaline shock family protein YloU